MLEKCIYRPLSINYIALVSYWSGKYYTSEIVYIKLKIQRKGPESGGKLQENASKTDKQKVIWLQSTPYASCSTDHIFAMCPLTPFRVFYAPDYTMAKKIKNTNNGGQKNTTQKNKDWGKWTY